MTSQYKRKEINFPMETSYEKFINHPFIQSIAENPKWTISDENKMPINMGTLMTEDRIAGASPYDSSATTTIETIDNFFQRYGKIPKNHAYFLDVMLDNFVVLDIEPECPDDIKQKLLNTQYIYGEKSLSGKGYHLIFHTPPCFLDYPAAYAKPAIKDGNGWYEILLNHAVTFTHNMIPEADNTHTESFNDIYEAIAKNEKESRSTNVKVVEMEKPDTQYADKILEYLLKAAKQYKKVPQDFMHDEGKNRGKPDIGKWEFAYISFMYWKLRSILKVQCIEQEHTYNEDEKAYFLYTIACQVIPYRQKHNEYRQNLPWLYFLAQEVIAKNDQSIIDKQNKDNN